MPSTCAMRWRVTSTRVLARLAGIDVDAPPQRRAAADLDEQLRRALRRDHRQLRRQPLLEPRRCLAAHPERGAGAADVRAGERGRLEQHVHGPVRDLALEAADDARERDRPALVGDDEHVVGQRARLVVERGERFAVFAAPDDDLVSRDAVVVEGVQRLAQSRA